MTRTLITLLILAMMTLTGPVSAENLAYVLYMKDADLDADGQAERMVVLSRQSSDPSRPGPKEFHILDRRGDSFETVFVDKLKHATFSNEMAPFQWQMPSTAVGLGVSPLPPGRKYPEFMLVFTPNSGDALFYKFDGKKYQRLGLGE